MDAVDLPVSITLVVALLAVFLAYLVALKYTVRDNFARTRLSMSSFFAFIVLSLSLSFWRYTLDTLPYAVPAFIIGLSLGYLVGVRAAERRLEVEGHAHYRAHFAHIHARTLSELTWWSILNYYTVMGALVLINLIGFSTVLHASQSLAITTSSVGALLLGTILPYLIHLWSIRTMHHASSTTSER